MGLSVSRVGGAAQSKAMKKVAGRLRIDLAQYRELKVFAQFGTDLDKATRGRLVRGERIVELLKQGQYQPLSVGEQVISLYAGVNGYLDDMEGARVQGFIQEFLVFMGRQYPQVEEGINTEGELTAEAEDVLKKALSEFKEGQFSGPG